MTQIEVDPAMAGEWMKKPRWKVSHFVRDNNHRPRHLGIEVGQAACGSYVTFDVYLRPVPPWVDTVENRCTRCQRVLSRSGATP